jgi:WD40 repeat protein
LAEAYFFAPAAKVPFMPDSASLLECIAKTLLEIPPHLVAEGRRQSVAPAIARRAWEAWSKSPETQRLDLQFILREDEKTLRAGVAELAARCVRDQPRQTRITTYLLCFATGMRRMLLGPSNGQGGEENFHVRAPEDLLPFLPVDVARFQPGEHPLVKAGWELADLLGVNRFGEVWRGVRPGSAEPTSVAVKFCTDPSVWHRLQSHDYSVLERFAFFGRHSGLAPLLEIYVDAEPPCLVYEFVDGPDLAAVIHAFHRQPERSPATAFAWSTAILFELAGILAFAHRTTPPFVHQDLKPSNIKVQRRAGGRATLRLTDFGIGGLSASQGVAEARIPSSADEILARSLLGAYTPLYASPQQLGGAFPDPRDDIYSLGVIWYQMLAGNLCAGRPNGTEWLHRLLNLGMNADMVELLGSCLEDNPEDRPQNAADLATRIEHSLKAGRNEPGRTTGSSSTSTKADPVAPLPASSPAPPKPAPPGSAVLTGHKDWILSLSFSNDGRLLASAGKEGSVYIWDVAAARVIRKIPVLPDGVNSADFSFDGRFLLTGGKDTRVRLYDAETGKELRTFDGHLQRVWSAVFSPNGRRALSGSGDGTLRLWDVLSGQMLRRIEGHRARIWSVAISADGIMAASGSDDTTVRLWEVETGKELRTFTGHTYRVWSVALSLDGQYVASASDDTTVRLWPIRRRLLGMGSSREVRRFQGHKADVRCVAFSPDSQRILSGGGDRMVHLWDVATGQEIEEFAGHQESVRCVTFAPDGRLAASAGLDATIRLWKLPGH